MSRRLSAEERQALSELNRILSETPQWSGEEELCIEMENMEDLRARLDELISIGKQILSRLAEL